VGSRAAAAAAALLVLALPQKAIAQPQASSDCRMVCSQVHEISYIGDVLLAFTFVAFSAACILFALVSSRSEDKKPEKQKFYLVVLLANIVCAAAYFAMLGGQGWSVSASCRQMFSIRYLAWIVSGPLIITALGFVACVELFEILTVCASSAISSFCLYAAANSLENVKWVWFLTALGTATHVIASLFRSYRFSMELAPANVCALYRQLMFLTVGCNIAYLFFWILCDGSGVVSVGTETLLYSFTDMASRIVFGAILLSNRAVIDRVSSAESCYGAISE
jgi:bacteriorhodopsin